MIRLLLRVWLGLRAALWIGVSLWLLGLVCAAVPHVIVRCRIALLPDHDYLPEVQQLHAEGKLSEAEDLADFVLAHCDGSNRVDFVELRDKIHQERVGYWSVTKRAGKGFLLGEGETTEELLGGIASDMVLYGDIRDLVKQGYFKITGKETDPVIAGLAAIGVLTEFVDAVDWAPAVLKVCRKARTLSVKFAGCLVDMCKRSCKARKLEGGLVAAFQDLNKLKASSGVAGTVRSLKYVDEVEDLGTIARYSQKSSGATAVILKCEGIKGLKVLDGINPKCLSPRMLNLAARKGDRGVGVLRAWGRRLRRLERLYRVAPLVLKLVFGAFWAKCVAVLLAFLGSFRGFYLLRRAFRDRCPVGQSLV